MSDVVDKIRSRGNWDIEIRPIPFDPHRIAYEDLEGTLELVAVRMRGWPVPYVDRRQPFERGDDWVGQDIDALMVSHLEAWRIFTSGQFVQLRGISVDWGEADVIAPRRADQKIIPVWEILFYLTEVAELAARLVLRHDPPDTVSIRAKLSGMANRGLIVGQSNRSDFFEPYVQGQDELRAEVTVGTDELIADPRQIGVQLARHILLRFGWKPSVEQLRSHQTELTERP